MEPEIESDIDLRTEKIENIRARDLTPAMIAEAKRPKPTWFVRRRTDGMEFPVEEREAWDLLNNGSSGRRENFDIFGHSDGKTYQRIVEESVGEAKRLEPEMDQARKEIEKYRRAEERMLIDEAVDMDGDLSDAVNEANKGKVIRLRSIISKLETKLETLDKTYRSATSGVVRRATAAEKEIAIANWATRKTWPRRVNVFTPGASATEREQILGSIPVGR